MKTTKALNIYILPFFTHGHLIPLVQLARLLASRGQQVTIITTPSNAQIFDKTIKEDAAVGHHIRIHLIKFPHHQAGLPEGLENVVAATDNQTATKVYTAAHLIQPQVEAFFKQSPPGVFIPDIVFTWSKDLANKLQIPRLVFNPMSVFYLCMAHAIKNHPETFTTESGPYKILGLPHLLTLTIKPSPAFAAFLESLLEGEEDSQGVVVNSFSELDAEYTQHYENFTGRKVWQVGPSFLMLQETLKANTVVVNENRHNCLTWLDDKVQNSVLYICFGSLYRVSDEQLYQIAVGLEASGTQFIWVVRRKNKNKNGEEEEEDSGKWLPEGFEERMEKEKRGILIKGWAPQPLILNHPAIGGFLTQCGWNAVAEAVSAGVPMLTMPMCSEQYYNEKLITDVHGFGVEVGGAEWSISPYDDKKEVVSGERIEKAVKRLMNAGEEGKKIRDKAIELKEKAWKAVKEGGCSHNSLIGLIDHLKSLVSRLNN